MLSAQGMSTRAIGSVLGVHHDTVASDFKAGVGFPTPEPAERIDPRTGEVESLDDYRHRVLADAEATGKVVKLTGAQSVADPTPQFFGSRTVLDPAPGTTRSSTWPWATGPPARCRTGSGGRAALPCSTSRG